MKGRSDMANERKMRMGRRGFLGAAGSLAAAPLLGGTHAQAAAQATGSGSYAATQASGWRKLSSDSMIVPQMLLGTFMVDGMNRLLDSVVEFIGGGESQVSQEMTLEVAPGALDVIEFRGVLG
jgi:hypothetical protein